MSYELVKSARKNVKKLMDAISSATFKRLFINLSPKPKKPIIVTLACSLIMEEK